ncbi:MAG: universal stress protein [Cyanobacteria bacterium CRU_2_1]|nr:universal stress protein [Cyanobacteria bacterium RU_5_0]NJR57575.1 universal stress protein [Cyanobacteria bacterium CRU_2_1]
MFQKILVAIDDSDLSKLAFEQALAMAKATHANLMLINVLSPFKSGYADPIYPGRDAIYSGLHTRLIEDYREAWEKLEQQGLSFLQTLTDRATKEGISTEFTQAFGEPGPAICNLADTWKADLIIMGRHGYKGLTELFWGSISNFVTHHAQCAVLTIPPAQLQPEPPPVAATSAETTPT